MPNTVAREFTQCLKIPDAIIPVRKRMLPARKIASFRETYIAYQPVSYKPSISSYLYFEQVSLQNINPHRLASLGIVRCYPIINSTQTGNDI